MVKQIDIKILYSQIEELTQQIETLKRKKADLKKEQLKAESEILFLEISKEKLSDQLAYDLEFEELSKVEDKIEFVMPNVSLDIVPKQIKLTDNMLLEDAIKNVKSKSPAYGFYHGKKIECLSPDTTFNDILNKYRSEQNK